MFVVPSGVRVEIRPTTAAAGDGLARTAALCVTGAHQLVVALPKLNVSAAAALLAAPATSASRTTTRTTRPARRPASSTPLPRLSP